MHNNQNLFLNEKIRSTKLLACPKIFFHYIHFKAPLFLTPSNIEHVLSVDHHLLLKEMFLLFPVPNTLSICSFKYFSPLYVESSTNTLFILFSSHLMYIFIPKIRNHFLYSIFFIWIIFRFFNTFLCK